MRPSILMRNFGSRRRPSATIALALLIAVSSPVVLRASDDGEVQKAVKAMQGTWEILSFTSGEGDAPAGDLVNLRRTVKDQHVVWKDGDRTLVELDLKLDPTAEPMALDSTIATGDGKGQTMQAIYKFEGGQLWVCFKPPGERRPKAFFAAPGSGQMLFKARRIDP